MERSRSILAADSPDTGHGVHAVLFERDGTLVHDGPDSVDPDRVRPMPGAIPARDALRRARIPIGVVTNQSGVGRGLITSAQLRRGDARVEALLGRCDVREIRPHTGQSGCRCRKPAPGMVLSTTRRLGVPVSGVVVVGGIGADVEAARAAGARAVLVPTPATRPEEVAAAPVVTSDPLEAVRAVLRPTRRPDGTHPRPPSMLGKGVR